MPDIHVFYILQTDSNEFVWKLDKNFCKSIFERLSKVKFVIQYWDNNH